MTNPMQNPWPELPLAAWRETYATLHLWSQVVGKIRLARSPWLNHSWHVALYVNARGLTTSPIPDGVRTFQIDCRPLNHVLRITTSDGAIREFALSGHSVASFYHRGDCCACGSRHRNRHRRDTQTNLPDPIRFSQDNKHAAYDPNAVRRFFHILLGADRVFKKFRTGFLGKAEPGTFFLGQLRSRGDALLGPKRATTSRRRAASIR